MAVSVRVAKPDALPVILIVNIPGLAASRRRPVRCRRIVSRTVPFLTVVVRDETRRPRRVTEIFSFVLADAALSVARTPERLICETLTRPFGAVSAEIAAGFEGLPGGGGGGGATTV